MNLGLMQRVSLETGPVSELAADPKSASFRPAQIESNTFLGIIEFTDQGMLRAPKQLLDISDFIKGRPSSRPLVLIDRKSEDDQQRS